MMKRIGILLASVCVAVVAQGRVFEVNGAFAGAADGKLPDGWKFHGYPGYKPDPRFETVAGPVAGQEALRIYEIHGESGMALLASPRIYAAVGDVIFVSLMAKGTGNSAVSLFRTTASNRWNQVSSGVPLKLTPEWQRYEAELPVTDGLAGPTRWVEVALGAKTGGDVCFADVVVKRLRVRQPDTGETDRFEILAREDYENPDVKRPGEPQIVEGEFAPGIPQRVKQGRYRVATPVSLDLAKTFVFPKGEDEFFQSVVRVYDFGGGRIARTVKGSSGIFSVAVCQDTATGGYTCVFTEDGKTLGQLDLPADALPADFVLSFDADGGFTFAATTLAGAVRRAFSGDTSVFDADETKPFTATLILAPGTEGMPAEIIIDEHLAAYARPVAVKPLPYPCEPEPAFDPVKAGWPLVFKDDFDGETLDKKEWFVPPWRRKTAEMARLDGKGRLVVEAAPDPENPGLLKSTAVWSKRAFLYGYFESRLKFTKLPGWWSAYWLYGMSNNNPFLDGLEIDIFEDFTTRSGGKEISHNMHVIQPAPQSALKSWSSHSELPGSLDDYYVIGCKWTPFEISLYINGKLMRSVRSARGRDTVTFDAFDTAACAVPLHIIFSGQAAGRTKGQIDFSKHPYPERFEVDSIKVYAYPDADTGPQVNWTCDTGAAVARIGDELRFSAEAKPNGANVTAVYLFDNGYPIAFKTEPPYEFRVPFTKAHYDTTRYMTPGISGVKPPFDGYTHAFIVFARDEKGRISKTPPILRIPDSVYAREPWDAKHRAFLRSGDAFNFDCEAPEAGLYSVGVRYVASDDLPFDNKLVLMVDGTQRDVIDLPYNQQPPKAISRTVALTAGKHRITFVPIGLYNVYGIEVGKEADGTFVFEPPMYPVAGYSMPLLAVTDGKRCLYWQAEHPYAFRAELETVHEQDMRDVSLKPAADECAFQDGTVIAIPEGAGEVLTNAAKDFLDYLLLSQGVSARVDFGPVSSRLSSAVMVSLVPALAERQYTVAVSAEGVNIAARDERTAAQALYYLEDLMNLRRAPFLKVGNTTRTMRFTSRMVHSGWGMDLAPEGYIERMAHYGYDSLLIYVKKVGKTKSSAQYEDINAIIRRAKRRGVDVWLYTSVKANVHPDDPGAQAVFDATYGEIARAYPEAKGLVLVGESCAFPSKDERACSDPYEVKQARGDKRPAPGWFPCRDYPDWLRCVKKAISRHAPEMKVLFWTYNWSKDWTPETASARLELIDHLPKTNTILLSTFEMPEKVTFPNGYSIRVSDYSITCPGPGKVFISEAKKAKANKIELFTMCNTGGHTWDFGTSPFQPIPYQWAKRWRALIKAHDEWGLSGLMETHHYGWYPNFVSELAKESYTDGGMPMAEHIRKIAARDYGEANADEVVAIWKDWSEKGANHPPTLGNQYGPFRIGPAYPFNFGGKRIQNDEFPSAQYAAYGIGICHLNFTEILWGERMYDIETVAAEVELLQPYADGLMDGAKRFTAMAAQRAGRQAKKAREMAVLAEYIGRSVITAINMKRGARAWEKQDNAALQAVAREEYENALKALPLVDADSRLGFECSMEYGGGREQIEWKLRRMRETYPGLFAGS